MSIISMAFPAKTTLLKRLKSNPDTKSLFQYSPKSTWLVTSQVFDVSSASRRACRTVLFDKLDSAKMHGLDMSNVTSQVEFGLITARGWQFSHLLQIA